MRRWYRGGALLVRTYSQFFPTVVHGRHLLSRLPQPLGTDSEMCRGPVDTPGKLFTLKHILPPGTIGRTLPTPQAG